MNRTALNPAPAGKITSFANRSLAAGQAELSFDQKLAAVFVSPSVLNCPQCWDPLSEKAGAYFPLACSQRNLAARVTGSPIEVQPIHLPRRNEFLEAPFDGQRLVLV